MLLTRFSKCKAIWQLRFSSRLFTAHGPSTGHSTHGLSSKRIFSTLGINTQTVGSSTLSNRSLPVVTRYFPQGNYRVESEPAFRSTLVPDLKPCIPEQATERKTLRRWVQWYCWSGLSTHSATCNLLRRSSPGWLCGFHRPPRLSRSCKPQLQHRSNKAELPASLQTEVSQSGFKVEEKWKNLAEVWVLVLSPLQRHLVRSQRMAASSAPFRMHSPSGFRSVLPLDYLWSQGKLSVQE